MITKRNAVTIREYFCKRNIKCFALLSARMGRTPDTEQSIAKRFHSIIPPIFLARY